MSEQSSLSAVSENLLPSNEESTPAQTIPADIAIHLDKTLEAEAGSECEAAAQPEPVDVITQLSDEHDTSLLK